jgi:hypothetical protein
MTKFDAIAPDQEEITWQEASTVGIEAARSAWAESARGVLVEPARSYGATLTTKQLSEQVQNRTHIRTEQLTHYWIGDVLGRVARDCADRQEPNLAALCVNADGSVGEGYGQVVEELTGDAVGDPDNHAAEERLECYRHFGADLPADGGRPQLTDRLAAARTRSRKAAKDARPADVCSACNMALPATGVCDNCG